MPDRLPKVFSSLATFAVLAAVVYVGLVGILYLFQRNLLYHPVGELPSPAESGVPRMQVISLETADGLRLTSWFAPPRNGNPMILYLCGNAGHIGARGFKADALMRQGFGVLLLSYRGFGDNPGSPTEEGLYADGRAALAFLNREGYAAGRIVLYGESLGTGVAVHLAAELAGQGTSAAAVILETPYTSITDVAASHYPFAPVRLLLKDPFDAESKIASVDAPVLIFHAEDDRVIPFRLARRLFERARSPKQSKWYREGGHEGLFDAGADKVLIEFIKKYSVVN